jgi:hypothetical protein
MQSPRVVTLLAVAALASCGPRPTTDPGHPGPLSAQEHHAEADRHEREAEAHESMYRPEEDPGQTKTPQCFDQPLAGVPTSGTESLPLMRPCWSAETNPTEHHRKIAADNLRAARDHRAKAAELLGAEKRACAELGEEEISHSPFFHREDIAAVERYEESGVLRGARVRFRDVPGLTASWLRHSIACHQARAAVMGYSTSFQPYCPLVLEGVAAAVNETPDGLEVVLRAPRSETAAAVLGRADDLLARQ